MRAILINPKLHRVIDVELADGAKMLDDMRRLMGCETMDHQIISDERDAIWTDDGVLVRGEPCFAFRLARKGVALGPFGGTCIIIGADRTGVTRPPVVPLAMIQNDVDWLDEIVPDVYWVQEPVVVAGIPTVRHRAVVTYSRMVRQ